MQPASAGVDPITGINSYNVNNFDDGIVWHDMTDQEMNQVLAILAARGLMGDDNLKKVERVFTDIADKLTFQKGALRLKVKVTEQNLLLVLEYRF